MTVRLRRIFFGSDIDCSLSNLTASQKADNPILIFRRRFFEGVGYFPQINPVSVRHIFQGIKQGIAANTFPATAS
ncbi:MAG: hypothetical protein R2874_07765 [Desulfobacterales bacterium]